MGLRLIASIGISIGVCVQPTSVAWKDRQHYRRVLGLTYPEAELRYRRTANAPRDARLSQWPALAQHVLGVWVFGRWAFWRVTDPLAARSCLKDGRQYRDERQG
jgi:hypothetical protein